jgi:hypothetical protein
MKGGCWKSGKCKALITVKIIIYTLSGLMHTCWGEVICIEQACPFISLALNFEFYLTAGKNTLKGKKIMPHKVV